MEEARPLGGNEKAFWKLSEASPLNFAAIAHLRGGSARPAAGAYRGALAGLQGRHPLLRAHIELRRGQPWFVGPREVAPVPLAERAVPRAGAIAVLEDELRRRIPWAEAPLARALLLDHGEDGGTFALLLHHAI